MTALDAGTGERVWRTDEEDVASNVVSAPILAGGAIVALEASAVVSLDPSDGSLRWRAEVVNPLRNPPFFFQGSATAAPGVVGNAVVALDVSGRAYGFDAATGAVRWDHALNDPSLLSLPIAAGEDVLVPTDSGILAAIDLATGHVVWRLDAGAPLLRGLADAGDLLVAVTGFDDPGLIAFGPGEGTLLDEPSPNMWITRSRCTPTRCAPNSRLPATVRLSRPLTPTSSAAALSAMTSSNSRWLTPCWRRRNVSGRC